VSALLELAGVSRSFGGLRALDRVSLALAEGEIVGLIGPNGAGKTTLVNLVTGVHSVGAGEIRFGGRRISGLAPFRIARLGIARTFQVVQPFPRMSVLDNVAAGALFAAGTADIASARAAALDCLRFTGLAEVAGQAGATLSLAGRKRLELAKSLATKPRLLLLDEVNAGLNSTEIDGALRLIADIAARGITVLLIEHLMKVVTRACSRVVVLHQGEIISDGPTASVMRDRKVVEAYLGSRYASDAP
jgi:ABC-type branched-subunit amino acid transport system ATPase component